MSDAFQYGDERDAFPDTTGPNLQGLFPTNAIDFSRRLGTDIYNNLPSFPTTPTAGGPEDRAMRRLMSQSIRYGNRPSSADSNATVGNTLSNMGDYITNTAKSLYNAAPSFNYSPSSADDVGATVYPAETSKTQAITPRDRSEYAYKPHEKSTFEKLTDIFHWSHPNNPAGQGAPSSSNTMVGALTGQPAPTTPAAPSTPAAAPAPNPFIKALTGNTPQNTTIAMGGANTDTQYPNSKVPMPTARPKNMGVVPQQKPAADANAPYLNNDPNDTRPGSLGEAMKLFPNRPLQQSIYYTEPNTEHGGGQMRRLGVGADTSKLDPANIARIWEPADMNGGEKFIRGAFETPGKNAITFNPNQQPTRKTSGPEVGAGYASGGHVEMADKLAREKTTPCHTGIIHMAVGGRTDHLPMNVLEGSYVLPADIVSGLGEGNTLAGAKILDSMFSQGPGGSKIPDFRANPRYPSLMFPVPGNEALSQASRATGGVVTSGKHRPVPIVAAGGEYVVHPDDVARYGGGNLNTGHNKLDNFVKYVRSHLIKTLKNLPGPKRD